MRKDFTVTIPDEPGKTTTNLNKTVKCQYIGPRYLVISVDTNTGVVSNIEGESDDIRNIVLNEYVHPGHTFHIIDASKHTFEAAFMTNDYENEKVEDYVEKLPTGKEYRYDYPTNSILSYAFEPWCQNLRYYPSNDTFSQLDYLDLGYEIQTDLNQDRAITEAREWLKKDMPDDIRVKVNAYLAELETFESDYAGVDAWKIPWPIYPPEVDDI